MWKAIPVSNVALYQTLRHYACIRWNHVNLMFGTVSVVIAQKNTGTYYSSALSCHTASCRTQRLLEARPKVHKTKTKVGQRPVLSEDLGLKPQDSFQYTIVP